MSDPQLALSGARYQGFALLREVGPMGMITLRAKEGTASLGALGCGTPDPRRITQNGDRAAAWMSPDEYLLMLPYAQVSEMLAKIAKVMQGVHHLAVDVSDARAMFRIEGEKADQVLRKLAPVDFDALKQDEVRRTRIAQVPAAFWQDGAGFTLICFRSVSEYVMSLLTQAAHSAGVLR